MNTLEVKGEDIMLVIGLMSGTSVDGIDAALVEISEQDEQKLNVKVVNFINTPYSKKMREKILECSDPVTGSVDKICRLNFELGELFAQAAKEAVESKNLNMQDVNLIGSHGQTIYHYVSDDFISTLQIGEASVIAERTQVTTVSNFRARDIAAGGQGAPLVPYVDYILFKSDDYNRVMQNIGGIGNFTYIPKKSKLEDIKGTDTGPGNMLIDGVVQILTNGEQSYDKDGKISEKGKISETLLADLMAHPFIKKEPPKTTGREVFGLKYAKEIINKGKSMKLDDEDIVATVTAFTAKSIVYAYLRFIGINIDQVIISGGGSYNPTLVSMIIYYAKKMIGEKVTVVVMEELGFSSDAKEAVAFAVLAYQTYKGRKNNVPQITGAKRFVTLGEVAPVDKNKNVDKTPF
ncbi:anhydro-N-acetylmuramic acid kinase [Petrotoga sp. DB-2]